MNKPYSESCDQNKVPILSVISPLFANRSRILEIGSGTGQHAVYFANEMSHLVWKTSDCKAYIPGIQLWLEEAALANIESPIELDVSVSPWPMLDVDAVFTANTFHIMSEFEVKACIEGVGRLLKQQDSFVIYGPFNYNGEYTSASNQSFDQWLKNRNSKSGIKDFEFVLKIAEDNDLQFEQDYAMPANNRILHFVKMSDVDSR